jgi:hypothetical protein
LFCRRSEATGETTSRWASVNMARVRCFAVGATAAWITAEEPTVPATPGRSVGRPRRPGRLPGTREADGPRALVQRGAGVDVPGLSLRRVQGRPGGSPCPMMRAPRHREARASPAPPGAGVCCPAPIRQGRRGRTQGRLDASTARKEFAFTGTDTDGG